MLTDGQWLTIHLKKIFIEKGKRAINILTVFFFISYKSGVKVFLKLIVNHCSKGTC